MTRINAVPPELLTNEWLTAECREMVRIPNELIKHPSRLKLNLIPKEYTLNTGHVLFHRDKLLYLIKRQKLIIAEMHERGLKVNEHWVIDESKFTPVMKMFCMKDWTPSTRDHLINIERLEERFTLRKKAYHFKDQVINCEHSFNEYLRGFEEVL